jgi:glutathione S-transferase
VAALDGRKGWRSPRVVAQVSRSWLPRSTESAIEAGRRDRLGPVLTLYQAEWCPFSSAVREILTELGLDFVARQVEAWPEDRAGLRAVFGSDVIPILETEDGRFFVGTRAIYGYLRELEAWGYAAEHRGRFLAHLPARESDAVGRLVEHFHRRDHTEVPASQS